MYSFKISRKFIGDVTLFGGIALLIIIAALLMIQGEVYANPSTGDCEECCQGDCEPEETEAPPPSPSGNNINADQKCKMLVFPGTITLGEPFEVCWIGSKFSDVKLGPNGSLSPLEADPYTKQLNDGKGLFCHSYLVPSFSNTDLDPGNYDFRCTGPGGTILATTVKVVEPE